MIPGYKVVREMPEDGQFLIVWKFNGEVHADSMKIEDGIQYMYSSHYDDWETEFGMPGKNCDVYFMVEDCE